MGKPFVKGDPRINRKGPPPGGTGGGRPSEIHRALCRRLVEENKLQIWMAKVAGGEKEDVFVTLGGKQIKVPANVNSRMKAVSWLAEQGYGLAPRDANGTTITPEKVAAFEKALTAVFQKHIPKNVLSAELMRGVMDAAAQLLDDSGEEADA